MRWGSLDHDRNAHFLTALKIATDVQTADLPSLLLDVEKIRTWPPLHAIVIGVFAAVAGKDYRLAVLPNVFCWGSGAVFIYLLSVELTKRRSAIAGVVALGFYLGSASHRVFATDFMLESMGATLTLSSLYFYVKTQQAQKYTIAFAISLSLLFFTKYNYWLLVALAIAMVEIYQCKVWLPTIDYRSATTLLRSWCFEQRRFVSNYLILSLAMAIVGGVIADRFQLWQPSEHGGARKYENITHLAYLALLLRIGTQWKLEAGPILNRQSSQLQNFFRWHVLPIAIWFALPKRLGYFVWYIGPFNGNNTQDQTLSKSFEFYWCAASDFYYASAWLLPASACLALVGLAGLKFLRREVAVVFVFAAIAILLTLNHGNQKVRFLHTCLPSIWILSGLGAGCIESMCLLATRSINISTSKYVSSLSTVASLVWLVWSVSLVDAGKSPESGHFKSVSSMSLPEHYISWLANKQKVAIIGSLPIEYFAEWSFIAAYPRQQRPLTTANMRWFHIDRDQNREQFERWIAENRPEVIVFIDVLEDSVLGFPDFEQFRQIRNLLS
ncbi:MAG: glycosyltransferase family 39 protein, partial [Aureliella sp.]